MDFDGNRCVNTSKMSLQSLIVRFSIFDLRALETPMGRQTMKFSISAQSGPIPMKLDIWVLGTIRIKMIAQKLLLVS